MEKREINIDRKKEQKPVRKRKRSAGKKKIVVPMAKRIMDFGNVPLRKPEQFNSMNDIF